MRKLLLTTALTILLSSASAQAINCENDGNCDGGPTSPVPEPATIGLMGAGIAAIGFAAWRKNRKK